MHSWGNSSGHICSSPLEAMVVMRMPGAARERKPVRLSKGPLVPQPSPPRDWLTSFLSSPMQVLHGTLSLSLGCWGQNPGLMNAKYALHCSDRPSSSRSCQLCTQPHYETTVPGYRNPPQITAFTSGEGYEVKMHKPKMWVATRLSPQERVNCLSSTFIS